MSPITRIKKKLSKQHKHLYISYTTLTGRVFYTESCLLLRTRTSKKKKSAHQDKEHDGKLGHVAAAFHESFSQLRDIGVDAQIRQDAYLCVFIYIHTYHMSVYIDTYHHTYAGITYVYISYMMHVYSYHACIYIIHIQVSFVYMLYILCMHIIRIHRQVFVNGCVG